MCAYCFCGDWQFRHNPPWNPPGHPLIPTPVAPGPFIPWDYTKLSEWMDLLQRIKDLEDKLGCPCEPNKADYLTLVKERLARLEEAAKPK